VLRILGQDEAALPFLEQALDLANKMHDELRTLHAMLSLVRIYTDSGNFDRAMVQLNSARTLATRLGDETALVEIEERQADIADRRGDRTEERRASLAGLEHAKRSGSSKWLELALVNLGDSYLKTRDYNESLKYSKQALPIIQRTNHRDDEQITLFNEGLAYIGLGSIKQGEKLAEGAITEALAGSDLLDAKELLREYADALEHAGYLMMAIQVYHRYDEISEKFMTNTRQRAFPRALGAIRRRAQGARARAAAARQRAQGVRNARTAPVPAAHHRGRAVHRRHLRGAGLGIRPGEQGQRAAAFQQRA
jgi:tetratricopeptide (TPR) repeat protein